MTEPEALQELREALARRLYEHNHAPWDSGLPSAEFARDVAFRCADAAIEAIRGAGWGPTAAHRQDSGLTAPSPAAHLPSDQSGTPQGMERVGWRCITANSHSDEPCSSIHAYAGGPGEREPIYRTRGR